MMLYQVGVFVSSYINDHWMVIH